MMEGCGLCCNILNILLSKLFFFCHVVVHNVYIILIPIVNGVQSVVLCCVVFKTFKKMENNNGAVEVAVVVFLLRGKKVLLGRRRSSVGSRRPS